MNIYRYTYLFITYGYTDRLICILCTYEYVERNNALARSSILLRIPTYE